MYGAVLRASGDGPEGELNGPKRDTEILEALMGAEKRIPNTQSGPRVTASLSTAAAARRSHRTSGRGGTAAGSTPAAGRASRPAPHPLFDDAAAHVPRAPEPAFDDLPELSTLPMTLGFGFWVPGAGRGVDHQAPSPIRQGEGRPLPGVQSSP
nr:hypothetical protein [Streptomyces sp.]